MRRKVLYAVTLVLSVLMLSSCMPGSYLPEYEVAIVLVESDKAYPVRDIEILYKGSSVKAGSAGYTDDEGKVKIGPIKGNVDVLFCLEGYDAPLHLLTVFKEGTYWVSSVPRHAPGMAVDWYGTSEQEYDALQIDWYCDDTARNTYWAVFNWDLGYAGFQEAEDGRRLLLMSLWDMEDGTRPEVEFYLDESRHGDFGGEGTGRNVLTEYDWEEETWYTIRVQYSYSLEEDKTYYTQWVRKEGGAWQKIAVISYPTRRPRFDSNGMFQEDWEGNNLWRSCRLRNMYARNHVTKQWESWNEYNVVTYNIPLIDHTPGWYPGSLWDYVFWDITYGVDWALGPEQDYAWVRNGGSDYTPNDKTSPKILNVKQANQPTYTAWLE